MNIPNPRDYSCKDEELTLLGSFLIASLNRDILDFAGYSPEFNQEYVKNCDARIKAADEVINLKSEFQKQREITAGINETYARLNEGANRLSVCTPITPSFFIELPSLPLSKR